MALNARIHANNPSSAANTPHVLGHNTPRTQGADKLLDVRNGIAETTSKFSVDKDGKVTCAGLNVPALEVPSLKVADGNVPLTRISGGMISITPPPGWSSHVFGFMGAQVGDILLVSVSEVGVIANGTVPANNSGVISVYRESGNTTITARMIVFRFAAL